MHYHYKVASCVDNYIDDMCMSHLYNYILSMYFHAVSDHNVMQKSLDSLCIAAKLYTQLCKVSCTPMHACMWCNQEELVIYRKPSVRFDLI